MIHLMDWIGLLIAVITGSVAAGGAILGTRIQLTALKESTRREIDMLKRSHMRDIELLQTEAKECRERIDSLLSMLARRAEHSRDD